MLSGLTERVLEFRDYEHDNLVFVLIAFIIFISRIMSMLRSTIFWVCSFEHLVCCVFAECLVLCPNLFVFCYLFDSMVGFILIFAPAWACGTQKTMRFLINGPDVKSCSCVSWSVYFKITRFYWMCVFWIYKWTFWFFIIICKIISIKTYVCEAGATEIYCKI